MKMILLLVVLSICSCNTKPRPLTGKALLDSLEMEHYVDSSVKSVYDTIGLWKAPIKVISAKMVKEEYATYRSVQLSYKNISSKKVTAIRFRWYGANAFGEPADMGSHSVEGFGGGFTEDPLSPGKTDYGTWNVLSRDGKKVVLAYPYEVVFADGTKWEL